MEKKEPGAANDPCILFICSRAATGSITKKHAVNASRIAPDMRHTGLDQIAFFGIPGNMKSSLAFGHALR
jgi:hypothetical protein